MGNTHHGQQARNDAFYGHVTADPGGVKHDAGMANRGPGFFGGGVGATKEPSPWVKRMAAEHRDVLAMPEPTAPFDTPYLDAVLAARRDTLNLVTHPLDAVVSTYKGIEYAFWHPFKTLGAAYGGVTRFVTASGPEKLHSALSFVGGAAYGGAFTGGIGVGVRAGYRAASSALSKFDGFWGRGGLHVEAVPTMSPVKPHPLEGMTPQQVIAKVNEIGLQTKKDNLVQRHANFAMSSVPRACEVKAH